MKKIKGLLIVLCCFLFVSNLGATTDFSQNEAHYQRLCAKRSSYNANRATCEAFEKYLQQQARNSANAARDIREQIRNTKDDIEKLIEVINQNALVIETKKGQIATTQTGIIEKEKEIKELEQEVMDRLRLMQEISGENFVIDFLMSSTSLDDFLTKMDGINAINESNNEVITDLNHIRKELAEKKKVLEEEKMVLEELQKEQDQMLKDYRSKEAELFKQLEEQQKRRAQFNTKLNNLNVNDITGARASKGFVRPVRNGTVTAVAWYYPASFGGGWHPGIDIANSIGTPIVSPANGVVLATGSQGGGYGNFMITAHQVGNNTYTFIYGHLNGFANTGATIKQGQTIAYMGSTGFSTGPHLHLEVFRHTGRSLQSVINAYRSNGDFYFGLGYGGIGSCSNVCRLKPQDFFGLRMGQSF